MKTTNLQIVKSIIGSGWTTKRKARVLLFGFSKYKKYVTNFDKLLFNQ